MQKFFGVVCVLVASVSLLVACGDDGGGSGSSPIQLSELEQEVADAYCARAFKCCNEQELEAELGEGATREECVTLMRATVDFQDELDSVAAGRMEYDAAKAGECLSKMEAIDCSEGIAPSDEPAACDQTFVALVEDGGACTINDECNGRCAGVEEDDDGNVTEEGTCKPIGAAGEECEYSQDCEDGTYCDSQFDPQTGETVGECKPIAQADESCGSSAACAVGHYCDFETGETTGTCAARKGVGEPCSDFDECESYECESTDGSAEMTCQAGENEPMCTGN